MTFSPDSAGAVSGGTLPSGTYRHIRTGVVWALVLFAIAIVPIVIATLGMVNNSSIHLPLLFAVSLWALGTLVALWAALPALRHWSTLPREVRSLAITPLLCIGLPQAVALLVLWL
ncbi:hypothetical protein [Reyranella massiliensis]|uniref:hypothetical protein n=1 Tax=Reyranella massiliensis TaxID=445220 RepID=UPI00030CF1AD|nr:hypothetical protein [Reyranella massiliensis]